MVRLVVNSWNKVILAYNGKDIQVVEEAVDTWQIVFASMVAVASDYGIDTEIVLVQGAFKDSVLEDMMVDKALELMHKSPENSEIKAVRVEDGLFYIYDDGTSHQNPVRRMYTSFESAAQHPAESSGEGL